MRYCGAMMLTLLASGFAFGHEKKTNVLFIVADDLRVELGCYGSPALTPNLDALAKRGVRFNHAYCQQALCNPSRSSFLTGRRPDTIGLWVNSIHFREKMPDAITLPQWFKQQGYVTRDVGKIFHNWHTKQKGDRRSWSADEFLYYANHGEDKPQVKGPLPANRAEAPHCQRYAVGDDAYYDGRVAAEAIRVLGEIKEKPFFLAVGFWKPHAPFNAPSRYWDLYQRDQLPRLNPARPTGVPEVALHDGRELRGLPPRQMTFTAKQAAEMRHGYYANVSYMDTQVGKVLAELDRLGLRENTLIVFLADHGYHLGEHGLWAKTSCFELDARVPLIFAPPRSAHAGKATDSFAELVDLFPTITALCGLKTPEGLEGTSLVPILENPQKKVKEVAFTQHPRPAYFDRTATGEAEAMGYSVRTSTMRYTEWRSWKTGKVLAAELYDHRTDPGEMNNRISNPPDRDALKMAQTALHRQFPPDRIPGK